MTKIEKTEFGFKLIFEDVVNIDQMNEWLNESKLTLPDTSEDFFVLVDMRNIKPISIMTRNKFDEGQRLYKERGMVRSVVILNSPIVKRQFQEIAKQSGIYEWERYIDASTESDWERIGVNWLLHASDPDLEPVKITSTYF